MNSSVSRYTIEVFGASRSSYWRVVFWGSLFGFGIATSPYRFGTFISGAFLWKSLVTSVGADLFPKVSSRSRSVLGMIPFAALPAMFASLWFAREGIWEGLFWAAVSGSGALILISAMKSKLFVELNDDELRLRSAWWTRTIPYRDIKRIGEYSPGWLRLLYAEGTYAVVQLASKPGMHLPWSRRIYVRIAGGERPQFVRDLSDRLRAARLSSAPSQLS